MPPVLKILRSGQTDINSADIWRFAFHSGYQTFKIATSGSQEITMLAGTDRIEHTVSHNLGYAPMYFAHILKGSYSWQVPFSYYPGVEIDALGGGTTPIQFYSFLDDANTLKIGIYVPLDYALNNESFTVNWLIMLDEF